MAQIYGSIEVEVARDWTEVVILSSLLLQHCDLNGCLFGVDNYAGYDALFPDRGIPADCSPSLAETALRDSSHHPSWALWSELCTINWDERSTSRDERIHEYEVQCDGTERLLGKWLEKPGHAWVREELRTEAEVVYGNRVFRRPFLRRADAKEGTDFDLVMALMRCLADRFGGESVRVVVWFE